MPSVGQSAPGTSAARADATASPGPANVAECEPCAAGKQKCVLRLAASRATHPGVRLHTDLAFYGNGHDGSTALLTVVDDYSRYAWVIPLRRKSDAAASPQDMINMLDRHLGRRVQFLHCDRGGEFTSDEFNTWPQA
jgi:Integrase core domain